MKVEDATEDRSDVLLISMPFNILRVPSLGLSLLKPTITSLGISTKILYLNLQFAKLIGEENYMQIRDQFQIFKDGWSISEWIFSPSLFNHTEIDQEGYIENILRNPEQKGPQSSTAPVSEGLINLVLKVREKVDAFLDESLHAVASHKPRIIGFNNIVQQHVASLALAKRIKAHFPDIFIVFGGPNCEGVMGLETIRQFPFIDAVVSGEGDIVFPQIVQQVLAGRPISRLSGVYTQFDSSNDQNNNNYSNSSPVLNMNSLPFPDCDDFFKQLENNSIQLPKSPLIAVETSRGCWWGEKSHCTFCSSYGSNITYRRKSGRRALAELLHLEKKYRVSGIDINDNILNLDLFKTLFSNSSRRQLSVELGTGLALQIKANLKKENIRTLCNAGFKVIQPGIESLSTKILKHMGKGVSAIQNIQCLKWCKEYGIYPHWNLLWGFPRESEEEYNRMAELIPSLAHLHPPLNVGSFTLLRFSPNFEKAEKLGLKDVTPAPSYSYIFPLAPETIANLAYYFTFTYRSPQDVKKYTRPVLDACDTWKQVHDSSDLFYVEEGDDIFIWDQRPIASKPLTILSGIQKILYTACDSIHNTSRLQKITNKYNNREYRYSKIEQILQPILQQNLMIKEGSRYLSLAIPVSTYSPKTEVFNQFQEYVSLMEIKKQNEALQKGIKMKAVSSDMKISGREIKYSTEKGNTY